MLLIYQNNVYVGVMLSLKRGEMEPARASRDLHLLHFFALIS